MSEKPLRFWFYPEELCSFLPLRFAHCPYRRVPLTEHFHRWQSVSEKSEADYYVFPYWLDEVFYNAGSIIDGLTLLAHIPDFVREQKRYVFFSMHDYSYPFGLDSIFFRMSAARNLQHQNVRETTVVLPYLVQDFGRVQEFTHMKFHTSFVGGLRSWGGRSALAEILHNFSVLSTFVDTPEIFHLEQNSAVQNQRRIIFENSLRQSWTVCAPRGEGTNTTRFFETCSAGRIPLLFSDDCILPWENEIPYSKLILRIHESEMLHLEEILKQYFLDHSPELLIEKSTALRQIWENYFSPNVQNERIAQELFRLLTHTSSTE